MRLTSTVLLLLFVSFASHSGARAMDRVRVSPDGRNFELTPSGVKFVPWGLNYDHDRDHRLLEEYWDNEWPMIEADFAEIKAYGANVVRVHPEISVFMLAPDKPNPHALAQFARLLKLAEKHELYLDITGASCYREKDVPAWYDALSEEARWDAQAVHWESLAKVCANSPAVFCYDLMNEPVVPAPGEKAKSWYLEPFAGMAFTQRISLDTQGRSQEEIALAWIRKLTAAVRKHDTNAMITVGLLDWSLPGHERYTGFDPVKTGPEVDFVSVHIYPASGKIDEALETLKKYDVGKPIVLEEVFPLACTVDEMKDYVERTRPVADGWISFYWGATIEEYEMAAEHDQRVGPWLKWWTKQNK